MLPRHSFPLTQGLTQTFWNKVTSFCDLLEERG